MSYPLHIAVIEDGADWQFYINQVLLKKNYFKPSLVCSWGEEFFSKYKEVHFDLVLLDISLPASDGYTVFQRIRSLMPKMPVVVFTSSTNNIDIARFTNSGISAYINKVRLPMLNEDLLLVLKLKHSHGYHFQPLRDEDLQILQLVCRKFSYEEIASFLNITKKCVENRMVRLCDKLGIDNKKLDIYEFCVQFGFWNPWAKHEDLSIRPVSRKAVA